MSIMIIFYGGCGYDISEYYFACHVAFGLSVASIMFRMLVDIMFWSMISEMMFTCGS